IADASTAAGQADGKVPEWLYEWVDSSAAAE
ncbi:MAG: hypothetical protein ACD_39C01865G0003, partial [uncultured bacterium]